MSLIIKAIIMGIVEGLTEFLPVSSTGHLIIAGDFLGFKGSRFHFTFEVVIQLGAILAVIFYYRRKILNSLLNLSPGKSGFRLWSNIFVAFVPSALLGVFLNDYIEAYLFSSFTVAVALIIGGVLMIFAENAFGRYGLNDIEKARFGQSLLIGIAQCLALFPGMSRSASTIMGGLAAGFSLKGAAEFSFFLAIPTMIAASLFSLFKGIGSMGALEWQALGIGFIVSFVVALIAIDKFLSYVSNRSLKPFAYYRIVFGMVMLFLVLGGYLK